MKFEDFTTEQRYSIAEFVYSYDSDIMIKQDAFNLLDVFMQKQFIDTEQEAELKQKIEGQKEGILEEMIEILFTSVEEEEGRKIMKEYFDNANKFC